MSLPLGEIAAQLRSFVTEFDPSGLDAESAADAVGTFVHLIQLAEAGKTLAAAHAASMAVHQVSGHRTPAEWLARRTGTPLREAKATLELASRLTELEHTGEQFLRGELSPHQARAIAAAAVEAPEREDELLEGASHQSLRELQDECTRVRAAARSAAEVSDDAARLHRHRRCRTWIDPRDGAFCLEARLPKLAGARLASALRERTDQRFAEARRAGSQTSYEACRADALVDLVTGAGSPPGGARASSVHVRVDVEALRRGGGARCEIPGVGPIPVETAIEVLGEAVTHLVITDGTDVRTVCNITRHVPSLLRVALEERDPVCVVPGCDRRDHLEIDHWRQDFADGGPTSYDNLARLCSYHHGLKTKGIFALVGGPGRWRYLKRARLRA